MSLKSEIESLRNETVAALRAAHNHFTYTKKLWRTVDIEVRRRKRKFLLSNIATGTRITERDFPSIAVTSADYYLPAATVQQFASSTEIFLTDLVRLWLTAYPMHLKGQVEVQAIVMAQDKNAILRQVIDQHVLSIGYKRPTEWFKHLSGIVSINVPTEREIAQFAELKATRDAFVHNRGIATDAYIDKAGSLARAAAGQILELENAYLNAGLRLCEKIVIDVGTSTAGKAPSSSIC